ncbi:hypothetical protein IYX23_14450 [Methylocystis sp. L43]|jgi:hypothetical protein|uniref:hypothetical protein n=1 Tax=unclassified Methylocystis TaxID=2625913 RepID=UPI0018C2FE42|nr:MULTISPECIES: hypothetical protein [unclassified Methylocystis]MBG0798866.1 hypothetical protein [Methylocystis sp. L43]MBG0806373.1 hypothetical protein [Methylocystis sp. H15]
MSFSNSRFVPLAFWVGFLALGLATNVNHEKKSVGFARDKQEMSVASASAKRLPLLIQDRNQIVRD